MRSFVGGADEGLNSQTSLKEIDTNSKYSALFTFKSNKPDYAPYSNESLFVDLVFGTDVERPPHKKAQINQNKGKSRSSTTKSKNKSSTITSENKNKNK